MLDTRTLHFSRARRPGRWSLRDALNALSSSEERDAAPPHVALPEPPPSGDDEQFPAIVVKAQEDARCRLALARLGYFRVRSQYMLHKLQGKPTLDSLENEFLWPTTDFVHDWLKQERKRIVARTRFPFLMTLLATLVAGLAFLGVAAVLG